MKIVFQLPSQFYGGAWHAAIRFKGRKYLQFHGCKSRAQADSVARRWIASIRETGAVR